MRIIFLLLVILTANFSVCAQAEEDKPIFSLNTNAFLDNGVLPVLYTCDGKDISPQFDWSNIPNKTQSLVFIMSDPQAPSGTFYHWVLYNIPKSITHLPQEMKKVTGINLGKN